MKDFIIMTKELQFLKHKNSDIRYLTFGEGEALLIALHGFADGGANMFSVLEPTWSQKYTIYAIDLPYHQKTVWNDPYYTQKDIVQIIQQILAKENKSHFSLMGYSMGGRIALGILPHFAKQLNQLFLVASDGLPEGKLLHAHMLPLWFRKGIAKLVERPKWIVGLVKGLRRWKLIPQFYENFIMANLANDRRRERLLNTWISLNDFRISTKKSSRLLNEHDIPLELIFGNRDTIILEKYGKQFSKNITNARIYSIDASHRIINPKLASLLAEIG